MAEKDASLLRDVESLVEPTVSGNPECPLQRTYKSVRKLAVELRAMGHAISFRTVAGVLRDAGYTLQSNR
ncbi:MAG: ISAzo13 family transposase, partial [Phycisphaeraceae bacterium]